MNTLAKTLEQGDPKKLRWEIRRLRVGADFLDLFGDKIPPELLTEYEVDDVNEGLSRGIQKKYASRPSNIRRCWNRTELFLPELMSKKGKKLRVLEMSTAHGGMLEVLRYFGHEVVGNDYFNMVSGKAPEDRAIFRSLNDKDFSKDTDDYGNAITTGNDTEVRWPYKAIIDSIGIDMNFFDAGVTPYPVPDKDFDVLLCMQAIEHYCHPKDWMDVVDEFCRITRKTIVILLNPLMENMGDEGDYEEHYGRAKRALKSYNKNGFTCVSTHMHWGEPAGFKLMAVK